MAPVDGASREEESGLGEEIERPALPAGRPARVLAAPSLRLRDLHVHWGRRTYLMSVLNLTPDSFSGDGLRAEGSRDPVAAAVAQAAAAIQAGADVLDVGGESTRPGAAPVSAAQERGRVVPVVAALRASFDVPISIDTSKADVAAAALDAGADLVNDVWALRADPAMAALVARRGVPVVLMHNRSTPRSVAQRARLGGRYVGVDYADLLADVARELREVVELALAAGVAPENIILDPGLGFGKTVDQNLELLDRADALQALGYPLLVGPSRKSFIGYTLDLPPEQRVEGTAAAVAVAITRGADLVRIHDTAVMARVARMTDAIVRRSAS